MEPSNQDDETAEASSALAATATMTIEVLDQPKSEAPTTVDGQSEITPLQEPPSSLTSAIPNVEQQRDKEDQKRKLDPELETPDDDAKPAAKRLRSSSVTMADAELDGDDETEPKNSKKTLETNESTSTQSTSGPTEAALEKTKKTTKSSQGRLQNQKRWRVHQMAEDYVELASNIMLFPTNHLGSYGYNDNATIDEHQVNSEGVAPTRQPKKYPLELISTLGFLKSPLRRPTVLEKWSPYEIAMFEAGMGHCGKEFYEIHKLIKPKSTKEVIDFYYIWKKTKHYDKWKKSYVPPLELVSDEEVGNTPVKKTTR